MKRINNRKPHFYTDSTGTERAKVPLFKAETVATVDAPALRALLAIGISTNWFTNKRGYVAVNVLGRGPEPVARLLMGANSGERVSYNDGDKLNMQGDNLTVTQKRLPRVDLPTLLAAQAEARKAREAQEVPKAQNVIVEAAAVPTKTVAQLRAEMWEALEAEGVA